jgi:hypothetical protein
MFRVAGGPLGVWSRDFFPFLGVRLATLYTPGNSTVSESRGFDISRVLLEAFVIPIPIYVRLSPSLYLLFFPRFADTKKDLKQITSHLLDMLVSKKVSGQGRDQALNLLNKNVPRKDLAIHDNSRTIYVVDNGEEVGGLGAHLSFIFFQYWDLNSGSTLYQPFLC